MKSNHLQQKQAINQNHKLKHHLLLSQQQIEKLWGKKDSLETREVEDKY